MSANDSRLALTPAQPVRIGSRALIIGRASSVWAEVALAKGFVDFDVVIAINVAGRDYPGRIDHWVTLHPANMPKWIVERARRPEHLDSPLLPVLWSAFFNNHWIAERSTLDFRYVKLAGGSSGMLAVEVALNLGIEKSVLCGIPLERSARYDDKRPWREAENHQRCWRAALPRMQDRVKSMSGWTMKVLGAPTKEWLDVSGKGEIDR